MKFQPDRSNAQTISGYGPGWIGVDAEKITHSVILGSGGLRQAWPCARFEDLTPDHFVQLATLEAELVILGSGTRNRFPPPAWLAPLMARRLGLVQCCVQPPAPPVWPAPARATGSCAPLAPTTGCVRCAVVGGSRPRRFPVQLPV